MDQDNASKLTATQNVIRNKFHKACAIRLENERDSNDAMKHLTISSIITNDLESKNTSSHNIINTNKKNKIDPNKLCDNLKTLLATSTQNVGQMTYTHQMKAILDELRDLQIII